MDGGSKRKSSHVVLLSARGKGHISPVMALARNLAFLNLSVTVVFPDQETMSLVTNAVPSPIQGMDIILAALPLEQQQEEDAASSSTKNRGLSPQEMGVRVGTRSWYPQPRDFSPYETALRKLLSAMKSSPSPPTCVIVDMVLSFTEAPITEHGLRRVQLYTAATSYFGLILVTRSLFEQGVLPISHEDVALKRTHLEGLQVPGLPTKLRSEDVPGGLVDNVHPLFEMHQGWLDHMFTSDAILFNSFYELDKDMFDALRTEYAKTSSVPLFPIGPLFPNEYFGEDAATAARASAFIRSQEEERCYQWLELQPQRSVVFISFGSWALLSKAQVQELAEGVETSGQRFLWVLPNGEDLLPEGFMERNSCTGLVLPGWAPQHLILTHPSLGAFLTHCGWNSTLECLTLAGVPMIGWPFLVDQNPNCRYLVDGLKIATEVHGDDDGFVLAQEIATAIQRAMHGAESDAMRTNAAALKAAAKKAVSTGGSSHLGLRTFIDEFCKP